MQVGVKGNREPHRRQTWSNWPPGDPCSRFKGQKGDRGERGFWGYSGPRGIRGPPGFNGKPGPKGRKGDNGIIACSQIWSNDNSL